MTVEDAQGRPIDGLTPRDFVVTEDGRRQKIGHLRPQGADLDQFFEGERLLRSAAAAALARRLARRPRRLLVRLQQRDAAARGGPAGGRAVAGDVCRRRARRRRAGGVPDDGRRCAGTAAARVAVAVPLPPPPTLTVTPADGLAPRQDVTVAETVPWGVRLAVGGAFIVAGAVLAAREPGR